MLGTKIIWMKYDVRTNAKQNIIYSSSNFQSSTFEFPDLEEIWNLILTKIGFVLNLKLSFELYC